MKELKNTDCEEQDEEGDELEEVNNAEMGILKEGLCKNEKD